MLARLLSTPSYGVSCARTADTQQSSNPATTRMVECTAFLRECEDRGCAARRGAPVLQVSYFVESFEPSPATVSCAYSCTAFSGVTITDGSVISFGGW